MPMRRFSGLQDKVSDLTEPKALWTQKSINKSFNNEQVSMTNLARQKRQVIRLQEQKIGNPECTAPALEYPEKKKMIAI